MPEERRRQDRDLVFALDIGTRSIIGIVGRVVDERLQVLAIEKEEHGKRAMLDGQIEDIEQVSRVARRVTDRLEQRLGCTLSRVCVAAAGRALRTERGRYAMDLQRVAKIDSDLISQLESGAVTEAETLLSEGQEGQRRFYLVGYTVSAYQLDHYPLTTLKGHNGQLLEAEVVATFLPSEVVESLYAVMEAAGLEVASLTLEPIAALNAVIPSDLRLLNLVLSDIGAGTSDIAVCRDGAVVGYTMATTAGDEITEELMRRFLVTFGTAERMKTQLDAATVTYRDVLGLEQSITGEQLKEAVAPSAQLLAQEIAQRILTLNGAPPSALFLAGGGSKLLGLRELVARALEMDERRVALAGNNYDISAFSDDYDLNDPEYATPLGIAVSAGLGLISDSYRILLNGKSAKLFRSGALTVLELLMMNGYTSADLLGRTGRSLSVTVDGQRMTFRGQSATPCELKLNGKETAPSALVYAGDEIAFIPAVPGASAERTLRDLLGHDFPGLVTVNGKPAPLYTVLHTGDQVVTSDEPAPEFPPEPPEGMLPADAGETAVEEEAPLAAGPVPAPPPAADAPAPVEITPVAAPAEPAAQVVPAPQAPPRETPAATPAPESMETSTPAPESRTAAPPGAETAGPGVLQLIFNGEPLLLEAKEDGAPYYLMDLLDRSGIDFEHLDSGVDLLVNGVDGAFTQELKHNDNVVIRRARG